MSWKPTASIEHLKLRAQILQKIRHFFESRNVLEVETPLLSHASITALHLHSFETTFYNPPQQTKLFLQTSPEFAMKRLLSAGSGSIFQICKAFRNEGETGRYHNPEFTMLEWYRVGFDHHQLMDEMDEFLKFILNTDSAERLTYRDLFKKYLNIDPFFDHDKICAEIKKLNIIGENNLDHDTCLQLLLTHLIEPQLSKSHPVFIYNYPASQAALAKLNSDEPQTAARFEVYINQIELANGFHELTDAKEQKNRFLEEIAARHKQNLPEIPLDENLIGALASGMPSCAGVALGIDRLIMIAIEAKSIDDVITFPVTRA